MLYAGAFMVLSSLSVLLGTLGQMQGSTALFGWSALFLAILGAVSVAAQRDGRPVVAGLSAFVAIALVGISRRLSARRDRARRRRRAVRQ